jgi:alpha-1,6-mannosyltransferase
LIGSVLVLVGGLVVATLPPSTPLLRHDLLVAVRGAEAGRMTGLALVLLGLGLLAHAWLTLCREVSAVRADDPEEATEALDLTRFAAIVWSAPLVLAPPLFSRDGWSYAAQGAMAAIGLSPYEHGPAVLGPYPILEAVDPMWRHTPTPYGPLPVWFGQAMAEHTFNPLMLAIGHRFLALVGLGLLAWAVPRLARWSGVNPAFATALVVASPLMLANGVGGLHNDLLMVGLMATALVVAAERGWVHGAVLGGLAAAVKVPGGAVCIGVALLTLAAHAPLKDRVRRLAGCAAVSVGVLLALGVVTGLGFGWVHALSVPGVVNTPLSLTTVVGGVLDFLAELVGLGTEPATFLGIMRTLGSAASLVVAVWVALRWRTGDRQSAVSAVATVVGVMVLLSTVVHLWYFLWPLPFLAALPLRRAALSGLVALSVVLGLVAPLDPSLHGAYLVIVFAVLVIAMLLTVLLLTPSARTQVERIVAARWLPDGPTLQPQPGPLVADRRETARLLDGYREHALGDPARLP